MKRLLPTLCFLAGCLPMSAQMVFSENLTLDIDSTKTIQGALSPDLTFKTEEKNVLTFKNTANLNFLFRRSRILNLINKLEISTYDNKVTFSGGYVHTEYRYLLRHAFEVYPFAESQWAGSRGMTFKVSTGLMSRYRLLANDNCQLFASVGAFFEFEKWARPATAVAQSGNAYSRNVKSHLSITFRHQLNDHWELTTTAIHQARPNGFFRKARFGGAGDIKYNITPKIGIRGAYRIIYDRAPIVNVRKDYNTVDVGFDLAF